MSRSCDLHWAIGHDDAIGQERDRGSDRGREALAQSLRDDGPGRAPLVDRNGRIIAGNKAFAEAERQGIPLRIVKTDGQHLIAVQRDDLDLATDPRAQALAIADNRVGELDLEWDVEVLKQLHADGLDLSAWWTAEEFTDLFAGAKEGLTDENAVVEPAQTDIVVGELFVLGRHRLLCGDATSASDVARLLDGATPVLMTTDPPYGVNYDPAWRHRINPSQRTAVGRVMNDDRCRGSASASNMECAWCADIAKLEATVPNVWTTAQPAGALTRALRALDR